MLGNRTSPEGTLMSCPGYSPAEDIIRRTRPLVVLWAKPGQSESPYSFALSLECMLCSAFPQWEPFGRTWPWEKNGLHDGTPVRTLHKLWRFWSVSIEICHPCSRAWQASYMNFYVISLAYWVCFFGLSLPSVSGDTFKFYLRNSWLCKPVSPTLKITLILTLYIITSVLFFLLLLSKYAFLKALDEFCLLEYLIRMKTYTARYFVYGWYTEIDMIF